MSGIFKPLSLNYTDKTTSLVSGLVFDAQLYEGFGTTTTELIKGTAGSIITSGATWEKNSYGYDLDFSAAASSITHTPDASVNSLTTLSWETLVYFRSTGGGGLGKVFTKKSGSGYFILGTQSSNQFSAQYVWGTSNATTNYVAVLNNWYHLVGTYDFGNVNNVPLLYVNGVLAVTGSAGTGTSVVDDANLYIGNRADGTRNFDGKIVYLRVWNRILNSSEVGNLYANPWRIYLQAGNIGQYRHIGVGNGMSSTESVT